MPIIDAQNQPISCDQPLLIIHRHVSEQSQRPPDQQVFLRVERRLFLKRRWRGQASDGLEFGFDLESRLHHGAVIHQTEQCDYIVEQLPEKVIELTPASIAQAALMAWKIGNLHLPVQILSTVIRVVDDPSIHQLLEREQWSSQSIEVVFNPLKVAAHAA